jgi:hypothetical protein
MLSRKPMSLRRRLNAFIARCHALIGSVCDPYRPELHYMRGPGPKWREKHQTVAERSNSVASAAARVQGTYRLA